MPHVWVRRCSNCTTTDLRESWERAADAHALPEVPRWARPFYGCRFRWACQTCGSHEFIVATRDLDVESADRGEWKVGPYDPGERPPGKPT